MTDVFPIPARGLSRNRALSTVLATAVALSLSACEETRHEISKALGMEKPDFEESEVLTGPPLTIPPDFDLRPPGSGEELYRPSPESVAPVVAAPQPQAVLVQRQPATESYRKTYPGAYQSAYPVQGTDSGYPVQGTHPGARGAYPPQGNYPAQSAYGQAVPQTTPQSTAQNVFSQALQTYGRANTGGYAATPSGTYNYGGYSAYGGQPYPQPQPDPQPKSQPYPQPYPQPNSGQPVAAQQHPVQDVIGYHQGQPHTSPPAANSTSPAVSPQECTDVVVDISGNYVCK
ncbi:MAG: hypothetical protein QGH78_05000 [Alphaproteobacteria bacterium]|nr:hypothetical protein [Alphaproteobacteria bacterium]